MRRRTFIVALAGVAAWPLGARAQQRTVRVIGLLSGSSFADRTGLLAALRESLNDLNYVEGKNVAFEYRSAEGQYGRLPAQAHFADIRERPLSGRYRA